MPTNACVVVHECATCHTSIRKTSGDCCVFCSYGSVPCPPVQGGDACCAPTNPKILQEAIKASRMSSDRFAIEVLAIDPQRLALLLAGERPLFAAARALCILISKRPEIAHEIAQDRVSRDSS